YLLRPKRSIFTQKSVFIQGLLERFWPLVKVLLVLACRHSPHAMVPFRCTGTPPWSILHVRHYSASPTHAGGTRMDTLPVHPRLLQDLSRRALLHRGLAAGLTVGAFPLAGPAPLWGAEAGQPKRGGILRLRGVDPPHFDPHLTFNFKTHTTLSF